MPPTFALLLLTMRQTANPAPAAEQATVVFDSHGSFMASGVPGTKHGIWRAAVFDDKTSMFDFDTDFAAKTNRSVVLQLPAGHHVFSPCSRNRPDPKSLLSLDRKPGKTYFIRAQSESSGIGFLEVEHGRHDVIDCEVAQHETVKMTPNAENTIATKYKGTVAAGQSIPTCPKRNEIP